MPYKDPEKQKKAQNEHYIKNKEKFLERQRIRRAKTREFVDSTKKGKSCLDCGNVFPPCAMDYHHRNPKEKLSGIGKMIANNYNIDTILKEIEKCDLVCATCHRIREYADVVQR